MMPANSSSVVLCRPLGFFLREEELNDPLRAVATVPKETLIMDTEFRPKQAAPVARSIVGSEADQLAELSEETLVGVTPSVSVTITCVSGTYTCAYSGDAG
jgi:bacteriocin leader peptide (microcyclamide/patellamide family)